MSDATLQLVSETHPLLSTVLKEFDFENPPCDPFALGKGLAELMIKFKGIGLSANQVGLPYRVFVMHTDPLTVCFNPKIVDQGNDQVLLDEGCLSYPGLGVKVNRPKNLKVRYTSPDGEVHTAKYSGMTARVFLHELDHMNGINFISRCGPLVKQKAMMKWKKLIKAGFNNKTKKEG